LLAARHGRIITGRNETGPPIHHRPSLAALIGVVAFPASVDAITFTTLHFARRNYTCTSPLTISGSTIVGQYFTPSGNVTGFTFNMPTQSWASLDDPDAPSRGGGTYPYGISGATVVGFYGVSPHGFICDGNTWTTAYVAIRSFGSYPSGYPTGISGSQIVGVAQYANGPHQGYTGSIGGPYTLLPNPLGLGVTRTGISGSTIVGFVQSPPQPPDGLRYDGTRLETLDDPIAPGFTFPFWRSTARTAKRLGLPSPSCWDGFSTAWTDGAGHPRLTTQLDRPPS
jgi:hypothetical protein